jgi:hypothetical protein
MLVPHRTAEWSDVLANLLGVVGGALLAASVRQAARR